MYTFYLIIITLSYITYVRIVTFYDFFLKVGYVIISKTLSRGRVPKQTCSQSAVRGVSTRDVEDRAFNEQPSDRKIEMADKKQKRKTSAGW